LRVKEAIAMREKVRVLVVLIVIFGSMAMVKTAAADPPKINFLRADTDKVGLYEKFELRLSLDATFANPFDPEDIDLQAEFTAPSGKKWNI